MSEFVKCLPGHVERHQKRVKIGARCPRAGSHDGEMTVVIFVRLDRCILVHVSQGLAAGVSTSLNDSHGVSVDNAVGAGI